MKTKGLMAESVQRWGVKLPHHAAYRAKKRALEKIQGAGSEQYMHLRSYAEELKRSNPNSTVIIKCGQGEKGAVFERIYVCLEACKAAFAHTCRPLIGLDACFLKGEFGGQLMAAVGKDENNQMIPIAYAVVEAETKQSWSWFIDLLLIDLHGIEHKDYAFISDQQKLHGLVPAIREISDNVEHRLCVKHLYGNWRKKYPGVEMKEVLWLAARATTIPDWRRAMAKMKEMNEAAWKDMMDLPPSMWTRSAYNTNTQCDLQVNNICEAFNSAILEHRDKPIITLLEELKHYITDRIVTQKMLMQRYKGNLCPRVQKVLESNKRDSDGWTPMWHGDDDHYAIFAVQNGVDKFVVNLIHKTCACRKWELTGIPCCHAIACMWHKNMAPEEFFSSYYRKSTFLACYSYLVMPNNGPKLWPEVDSGSMYPPSMRRAPGRPKKQRRKANDGPKDPHKLPRHLTTVRCKNCGKLGHNIRSCKGKTTADREIPKGGNKQKQKMQKRKPAVRNAEAAAASNAPPIAPSNAPPAAANAEAAAAHQPPSTDGPTVISQGSQAPQPSQALVVDN